MKLRRPTVENKGWAWWLTSALALGLLVGAMTYWASIWLAPPVRIAPAGALSDQSGPLNIGLAKDLFGRPVVAGPAVVAAVSSNIKVVGIIAAGPRGSAILSIDGKPGKAFAVGDKVDGRLTLLGVDARQVSLGEEGKSARQSLSVPAVAEVSVLTRGPAGGSTGATGQASPGSPAPGMPPGSPGAPLAPPPASFTPPASIPVQQTAPGTPSAGLPPPGLTPPGSGSAQGMGVGPGNSGNPPFASGAQPTPAAQ